MQNKKDFKLKLNKTLKKLIFYYFYIIFTILITFTYIYWYLNFIFFTFLLVLGLMFHVLLFSTIYMLDYKRIKSLIQPYFFILTLFLFPFATLLWHYEHISGIIWYLFIPFGVFLFFSYRTTVFWFIYIFTLSIISFFVSKLFNDTHIKIISKGEVLLINTVTIFFILCIIILIVYYWNKIAILKNNIIRNNEFEPIYETAIEKKKKYEHEKYKDLYDEIVNHFKTKSPFIDPDYNISQLANALNSNLTYISKSIKLNSHKNFNTFINIYRIKRVKKLINEDYHNKYTLKFIYTSCGFRHQSTFNKVFKQIEGITPSEFIKKYTKEN